MSAPLKLAAFTLLLAGVFAVAAYAGSRLDPAVTEPAAHADDAMAMSEGHGAEDAALPGLAVASGGLTMRSERTKFARNPSAELRFAITGDDGEVVHDFDVEHERRMHVIVVRRDFERFQHLHPRQLPDGTWTVDADLSAPGTYRMFADFAAAGESATLGTDLFVAGNFRPRALPEPAVSAAAGDRYRVELSGSDPRPGATAETEFTVTRDGEEIAAVEPYLGADGHLVALREHDQAFLHTHPEGEPGGAGPILFGVEYPTPGRYRLFLQFKHRGEVRTAAFTQGVDGGD